MAIYLARELLSKLKYLVLSDQNEEGELVFVGSNEAWLKTIDNEQNV